MFWAKKKLVLPQLVIHWTREVDVPDHSTRQQDLALKEGVGGGGGWRENFYRLERGVPATG